MYSIKDCSAETLFPDAPVLVAGAPLGYAVNSAGPHGFETKSPVWDVVEDPCQVLGCVMVLTKFLDGSPVAIRYRAYDVYKTVMGCGWEMVYEAGVYRVRGSAMIEMAPRTRFRKVRA